MDKCGFGPLNIAWMKKSCYSIAETGPTITKQRCGIIFIQAWIKAITPANINVGFRVTGIYPFNLSIIPSETFAPVALSQNDSPVRGRSGTDALAERNIEMYSPSEYDDGAVGRDKSTANTKKMHYEAFIHALRSHNKGKKSICNSWTVLLKIKLQYTIAINTGQ
jgi:hypothetical protein